MENFSAVLFDLDGTLIDTAPDLAFALNSLMVEEGLEILPYNVIRSVASHGSASLLGLGFGISTKHDDYASLQQRFLQLYQSNIARETALFDGMEAVISALESANITWGIVTNKSAFLTDLLIKKLHLGNRSACVVSADTTPFSKPHHAPILHACDLIHKIPEECIYIGDAERDIEAGKNANMRTVVALYGYLSDDDHPEQWQADASISHPRDILQWI